MTQPEPLTAKPGHYEIGRRDGGSSWHVGTDRARDCDQCRHWFAALPSDSEPLRAALRGVRTWMRQGSHELIARDEAEAALYATLSDANEGNEPAIDIEHLINQREWSLKTFGPGDRSIGVVDHIVKELCEIVGTRIVLEMAMNAYDDPKQMTNYVVDPPDSSEFVDVVILALDGLWRGGYEPKEIIEAIKAKQAKNEKRIWPDWREFSDGKAIEHVKIPQEEIDELLRKETEFQEIATAES